MACKKCGNKVLSKPMTVGAGNTSQPCPICGEQNYSFTDNFRRADGAADIFDFICARCGDTVFINHHGKRKYCDSCLGAVRSEQSSRRSRKLRKEGKVSPVAWI